MAMARTWGDELTLRACADSFQVPIHVVQSTVDNWRGPGPGPDSLPQPGPTHCRSPFWASLTPPTGLHSLPLSRLH